MVLSSASAGVHQGNPAAPVRGINAAAVRFGVRYSDSDDEEGNASSEDVESWLLQCDRSQCATEMEVAIAAEAGACPRAAVMPFRRWCKTEEITGALELMSAWVAEPGFPSLSRS